MQVEEGSDVAQKIISMLKRYSGRKNIDEGQW
jgi:hypothetical protein